MDLEAPPEYRPYLGRMPSFVYLQERTAPEELVVHYREHGEFTYRRNGSWGVETPLQGGDARTLTSRRSAHMRWPANFDPQMAFFVLPNEVVHWLWDDRVSLSSLHRQRLSHRAVRADTGRYETWFANGWEALFWKDVQNRWLCVRAYIPRWNDMPYFVFEWRFWWSDAQFEPLVWSRPSRGWVMAGHPDAEYVDVPPGAVAWLNSRSVNAPLFYV